MEGSDILIALCSYWLCSSTTASIYGKWRRRILLRGVCRYEIRKSWNARIFSWQL